VIIIFKKCWYLFNIIKEKTPNIQGGLLVLILLSLAGLEFTEVILRYILHKPLIAIEEILIFPTVWCFFWGSANASLERNQINAKIFETFLKSPKAIKIYKIIMTITCFIIDCCIIYHAYKYFKHSIRIHKLSPNLFIPLMYAESAVFIGFLLMGIYTFVEIICYIKEPVHEFKINISK